MGGVSKSEAPEDSKGGVSKLETSENLWIILEIHYHGLCGSLRLQDLGCLFSRAVRLPSSGIGIFSIRSGLVNYPIEEGEEREARSSV